MPGGEGQERTAAAAVIGARMVCGSDCAPAERDGGSKPRPAYLATQVAAGKARAQARGACSAVCLGAPRQVHLGPGLPLLADGPEREKLGVVLVFFKVVDVVIVLADLADGGVLAGRATALPELLCKWGWGWGGWWAGGRMGDGCAPPSQVREMWVALRCPTHPHPNAPACAPRRRGGSSARWPACPPLQ